MSFKVSRAAREGRWGPLAALGQRWVSERWPHDEPLDERVGDLAGWRRWGLSPRLAEVARLVPKGSAVVDIGTDHALLPLALTRSAHSPEAIGVDINAGPLKGARARLTPEDRVELALADGFTGSAARLEALWCRLGSPERGLCACVCGVGGAKVTAMIPSVPCFVRRLILQPNLHHGRVRWALETAGWTLTEERLTLEGERIFLTLAAERPSADQALNRTLDRAGEASEWDPWEVYDSALLSQEAWYPLWLWVHLEKELELISSAVEHSSEQARRHFDQRRRRASTLTALLERTLNFRLSTPLVELTSQD